MAEYSKERLWFLKISKDFFSDYRIKALQSEPNGDKALLIYLKLMCESCSHAGYLRFSTQRTYSTPMLAAVIGERTEDVENSLCILFDYALLEVTPDGSYFLPMVEEVTSSITVSAEKRSEQRSKKKQQSGDKLATNWRQEGDKRATNVATNVHQDIKRLREQEIKRETTDSAKASSSVSKLKPVKTSQKQSALCGLLVECEFLQPDELQDPQYDELFDFCVKKYGFKDTKITLKYIIQNHSDYKRTGEDRNGKPTFGYIFDLDGIANKYLWLEAAMTTSFKQKKEEIR